MFVLPVDALNVQNSPMGFAKFFARVNPGEADCALTITATIADPEPPK